MTEIVTLKRPLPPDRSYSQVLNHYLVEKAIASKLRNSTRNQRKVIYETMYDELFRQVPDHPRLHRSFDDALTTHASLQKMRLVERFLENVEDYLEFAPGDCRFSYDVASLVTRAYGVDISDQRNPADKSPDNFRLIIYDGYNLDAVKSNSIDLIFSDQLIEHFHPEDTKLHFETAKRILKPGGRYVFRTPHAQTGPHDISMYFSDDAEGFHLKEWTYVELRALLRELNFASFQCHSFRSGRGFRLPFLYFLAVEKALARVPTRFARPIATRLISSIFAVAVT